jgi:formylmethanofuran dehydrogenase subunit D
MFAILITGRTINQGCGKEQGKFSKEYIESVSFCEINPADMKKNKIKEGSNVKITTDFGFTIVKAKKSNNLNSGIVFIPYGPWANQIITSNTSGTGMPLLKGTKVKIEPTNEKISNLQNLFNSYNKKMFLKKS